MNRRDAISRVGLLLGGTIIGANIFLEGCTPADKRYGAGETFSADDISYLDEIAETILPETSTPGAKAAGVGTFMTVMVNDCYTTDDQKIFRDGMNTLNKEFDEKYDKSFVDGTPEQRHEFLVELDKSHREYMSNKKADEPAHYFRMFKELTLLGYFTSEVGSTQALRYVESPGKYEGCIPYKKGDRAWAL